jgi:hypothetical protein
LRQVRIRVGTDAGAGLPREAWAMVEPAPPFATLLGCLTAVSLGIYLLLAALALEWYPVVPAAVACFVAAGLPVLRLVAHR